MAKREIDAYLKGILEYAKQLHPKLEIDLEDPTREQRLEAAVAMRKNGGGFTSMEIMKGRRVSSTGREAEDFAFLIAANNINDEAIARTLFDGF